MNSEIELRPLSSVADVAAAARVLAEVWGVTDTAPEPSPDWLRALAFTENYVAGAFVDRDHLVGAAVGFWGHDRNGPILHSHATGVVPAFAGRGVGYALKQHQRSWTLEHNVERITWTFDPLIRRNAHFNLAKLGAYFGEYHESFYGEMRDSVNAGDLSDRVVAVWDLRDATPNGSPLSGHQTLTIPIPADIVSLRRTDPGAAMQWRLATRAAFRDAFGEGFCARTISKNGDYTLVK